MKGLAVLGLFFLAIASGCGDSGASQEELHAAWERGHQAGELTGHNEAEAEAKNEWQAGYDAGYAEGEEEAFELDEEIEREFLEEELEEEESRELERQEQAYLEEEGLNPYPIRKNGEPSYEFEPDDIERAEEGYEDEALREYCEGTVSEAQELGCLSHVDPSEVP